MKKYPSRHSPRSQGRLLSGPQTQIRNVRREAAALRSAPEVTTGAQPPTCGLHLKLAPIEFRALTRLAEEWSGNPEALECEAAAWLLMVSLANIHLLREPFTFARAYCSLEGISLCDHLDDAIRKQFFKSAGKKGGRA